MIFSSSGGLSFVATQTTGGYGKPARACVFRVPIRERASERAKGRQRCSLFVTAGSLPPLLWFRTVCLSGGCVGAWQVLGIIVYLIIQYICTRGLPSSCCNAARRHGTPGCTGGGGFSDLIRYPLVVHQLVFRRDGPPRHRLPVVVSLGGISGRSERAGQR